MALLTVSDISLQENGVAVLHPISFSQQQGRKLALAGESGAGKSTLLQIIAGLVQPSTGTVHANGRRVRGPADTLVPGHPGVAYLSQKSDLPRSLRVEQVLRYASRQPAAQVQPLYELCRIAQLLGRRTDQLSGGEQQRVALARLLLGTPRLLLLDEPYSNLDRAHKRVMQAVVAELGQELGISCLLVSHDAADTLPWADEILVLHRGRLIQQGSPEQLYRQPVNEYTAGLFGDYSLLRGADLRTLAGRRKLPLLASGELLVRPEQLRLGPARGRGLVGTVRAVRFLGSAWAVEVALAEGRVEARAAAGVFAPGEQVSVALAPSGG